MYKKSLPLHISTLLVDDDDNMRFTNFESNIIAVALHKVRELFDEII